MRPSAAVAAILALAAAGSAHAQAADPIGDLLARRRAPPPAAPPVTPAPPPGAVTVDEVGRTPDSPPTARDLAYESRIRASFASAQGFQGPMDGAWTLSGDGGDLYTFKLVDHGEGALEGAWLDLRRTGALDGSGFIDKIERVGSEMTLTFARGVTVDLATGGDGRWTGTLDERGMKSAVSLRRTP